MKKLFLLTITTGLALSSFAQYSLPTRSLSEGHSYIMHHSSDRTTGHHTDTVLMENATTSDSILLYYAASTADSGFTSGMNGFGDNAFAERYDFNGTDSSVQVAGVATVFGGVVSPTSINTVTFKLWNVGPQVQATNITTDTNIFYSGFPSAAALDSLTGVYDTTLGVTSTGVAEKEFLFPTISAALTHSFFIGYSMNYNYTALGGDTLALIVSGNTQRVGAALNYSGTDTIINDQNAFYRPGAGWLDNNVFGGGGNFFIFPIAITHVGLGFKGITNKNFTFFGNYPNPATSSTNIKFSLAVGTDVTVIINDMSGRNVKTIKQTNLGAGEHIIPVETATMAAGDYIYTIYTPSGDGIASKLAVIK